MLIFPSQGHRLSLLEKDIRRYSETSAIKDTPKEDRPPNKGQAENTLVYTLYKKLPLKEDIVFTRLEAGASIY